MSSIVTKPVRVVCCCFRKAFHCVLVFFILTALLAVAAYFAFPAVPKINAGSMYIDRGLFLTAPTSNGILGFNYSLATNVTVDNGAYYNIGIRQVYTTRKSHTELLFRLHWKPR